VTFNDHFTLNFHYYEQRFQILLCILTVEPVYRIFLLYHVTNRYVRKRTVIRRIFGIRVEGLRIFRKRNLRALHRRNDDAVITVQHGSADTVVRAMNAFNGKCRFSGYASSETP